MIPTLLPNKSLPEFLRAGDTLAWNLTVPPPATDALPPISVFYVLTAFLANQPVRIHIPPVPALTVAVDVNGNAAFALTSPTTAAWQPGRYQWVLFGLDAAGNRSELAQGVLRVDPDPAGTNPADPRSYNVKLLAAIRCLLAGKALDDTIMYKIGGRELTKMPVMDLMKWEGLIEARVRRERIRRGEFVRTKTRGILFGGRGNF